MVASVRQLFKCLGACPGAYPAHIRKWLERCREAHWLIGAPVVVLSLIEEFRGSKGSDFDAAHERELDC